MIVAERKHWGYRAILYILIIAGAVISIFPIVWMVMSSVKPDPLIVNPEPIWLFKPTMEHYKMLFTTAQDFQFTTYFFNSLIISGVSTLIAIAAGYFCAYSISRFNTGGTNYSYWILSIRMLPPAVFITPVVILFGFYKLMDTRIAIIMMYLIFNVPFAVWIFLSFIDDIPIDLEDAALLDGYSRFDVLRKIIFPLTAPSIVAVGLICFIFSWNEYLFALVLSFQKATTITIGAARFVGGYGIWWGRISAALTVAAVIPIALGLFGQRYLVRGLTMGAVK
jgi:multiple sugar transport system permease protein